MSFELGETKSPNEDLLLPCGEKRGDSAIGLREVGREQRTQEDRKRKNSDKKTRAEGEKTWWEPAWPKLARYGMAADSGGKRKGKSGQSTFTWRGRQGETVSIQNGGREGDGIKSLLEAEGGQYPSSLDGVL